MIWFVQILFWVHSGNFCWIDVLLEIFWSVAVHWNGLNWTEKFLSCFFIRPVFNRIHGHERWFCPFNHAFIIAVISYMNSVNPFLQKRVSCSQDKCSVLTQRRTPSVHSVSVLAFPMLLTHCWSIVPLSIQTKEFSYTGCFIRLPKLYLGVVKASIFWKIRILVYYAFCFSKNFANCMKEVL